MAVTINGDTGVTTPGISNSEGYTGDGLTIAAGAPSGAVTLDVSGNLGIGTTSTSGYKLVVSDGTTYSVVHAGGGASYYGAISNSPVLFITNNTERARIDSSGRFIQATGCLFQSVGTYNNVTGNAANVYVGSGGVLERSTSSLKYKKNVQDASHGLAEVMQLRSVTYEGKTETDSGKTFGGLIAEEVDAVGLTEFVQYADDGTPDALAYGNMVSLCIKAIQEQQAIINAQQAALTQLQAEIAALKGQS